MVKIIAKSPYAPEAVNLLEELSKSLEDITGSTGKQSFDFSDVCVPRSVFVVAYDNGGEAIGCGGIRPINENTAEVKRMFAKVKTKGVGSKILSYLENEAIRFGYSALWVETRIINEAAVSFYRKNGYVQILNYGKYANDSRAICFEKKIGL